MIVCPNSLDIMNFVQVKMFLRIAVCQSAVCQTSLTLYSRVQRAELIEYKFIYRFQRQHKRIELFNQCYMSGHVLSGVLIYIYIKVYHIISYHIISYHIISYLIMTYHITSDYISFYIISSPVVSCHVISYIIWYMQIYRYIYIIYIYIILGIVIQRFSTSPNPWTQPGRTPYISLKIGIILHMIDQQQDVLTVEKQKKLKVERVSLRDCLWKLCPVV